MTSTDFDPYVAYGVTFGDAALARCVRETAKMSIKNIDVLKCYQAGVRHLDGIEHVVNLLSLDLHMNEVQVGAPLAALKRIEELHLGINLCKDVSFLKRMTSLKSVTLFGNEIEDVTPLQGLVGLEILHLRFNMVDDLRPLAGLTKLVELSVSDNLVDDLAPLAGMTRLEVLNFYKNDVADLSPLAGMKRLRQVYFGQNPIRDPSVLLTLPDLIDVSMDGTQLSAKAKDQVEAHVRKNKARLGIGRGAAR